MRRSWHSLIVIIAMVAFAMTFSVAGSEPDPEFSCFTVADDGPSDGSGGEIDGELENLLTAVNPDNPDPDTNETNVGPTGTQSIEAVAFQPGTGVLFAADGGRLGTLDLDTGAFSPKASFIGTGDGSEGEVSFDNVDGLTFDPDTGTLYGSQRQPEAGEADLLIQIDPATGAHVSGAFGGDDYVVIEPVEGLTDIDDIAMNEDSLFGIANEGGDDDRLVTIDPATGDTTDVGPTGIEDIEGLGFAADGRLLGTTGKDAPLSAVLLLNTATGQASELAEIDNGLDYESIDCREAEEPPPPPDEANVGGTKWNDRNANGVQDGREEGVEGVEIHLFNEDGSIHEHTFTAADGSYGFEVPPGTYTVCETVPAGKTQTFPTEGPDCSGHGGEETPRPRDDVSDAREPGDGDPATPRPRDEDDDGSRRAEGHEVTVAEDEQSLDNDFGNTSVRICDRNVENEEDLDRRCNVSGTKWDDADANGVRDEGEEGVADVRIHLFNEDGSVHLHTRTGRHGIYGFFRVPDGTYTVCEGLPEGRTQTFPTEGPDCTTHEPDRGGPLGPVGHEATVERRTPSRGNDFGNTGDDGPPPEGCPTDRDACNITGTKFNDVNGDGIRDADDVGVGGVDIDIFDEAGAELTDVPGTDVTEDDGFYGFDVEPGTYTVCEVPPAGPDTQTLPTEGADCSAFGEEYAPVGYEITIAGEEKSEGNDFGNAEGGIGTCQERGLLADETLAFTIFGQEDEPGPVSMPLHDSLEPAVVPLDPIVHEAACLVAVVGL